MTAPTVREITMRSAARELSTLERINYEDCFLVPPAGADEHTPEEWARAMVEGAPAAMRASLVRGWKLLGLVHGPADAAERVLGWEIRRSDGELLLLGAHSRIGMPAELLFKREPDGLLFATFIQQSNPLAKLIWAPVGAPHRRVVAELLAQAASRLRAVSSTASSTGRGSQPSSVRARSLDM